MKLVESNFPRLIHGGTMPVHWSQVHPSLVVFIQALRIFKEEYADQVNKVKFCKDAKSSQLSNIPSHEIEEVFSKDELDVISVLASWNSNNNC